MKYLSIKPGLSEELDVNTSAMIKVPNEWPTDYPITREDLDDITKKFNDAYKKLEDIVEATENEAMYELFEDYIGGAFSEFIAHLAHAQDPNNMTETELPDAKQ